MFPARSPAIDPLFGVFTLVAALGLVACASPRRGGSASGPDDDDSSVGDDDDDASVGDDDDDSLVPGSLVPDSLHCDPVSDWDSGWSEFERRILELTNEVRAQGANCGGEEFPPAPPVVMQEHLRCSSRLHSVDMVVRDFFEHTNPDGVGPGQRISEAGYNWMGFGENIGWGYASPEGMMEGWITSPGHCSNIMTDWFTELGVGYFEGPEPSDFLWTQNFGDR